MLFPLVDIRKATMWDLCSTPFAEFFFSLIKREYIGTLSSSIQGLSINFDQAAYQLGKSLPGLNMSIKLKPGDISKQIG